LGKDVSQKSPRVIWRTSPFRGGGEKRSVRRKMVARKRGGGRETKYTIISFRKGMEGQESDRQMRGKKKERNDAGGEKRTFRGRMG